jgi:glycosyltransferase involved in cell wall biosynthesis
VNIVLINHYAGGPPWGMEFRPWLLAREWVRLGHQVTILSASYSHVRSVQPEPSAVGQTVLQDGIGYVFYPTPAYQGNGVGRLRNIASFLRQVWRDAPRWARELAPQVVIASSTYPMDTWVARRLARLARCRWVYEVHDLWPLSLIELSGMPPWHPFALLCQAAENSAYRRADAVVSMLPKVHSHMAAHGLDLQRLHIVPNGISPQDWALPLNEQPPLRQDVAEALASARHKGQVVVGYAGSMGRPNALDTLLDAAVALQDKPLRFVLVGSGHEQARLQARAVQAGLQQVHFLPPVPKAMVPRVLAGFDIAYIGWQQAPIYRFGIAPNKLLDYMMAGCAVLHSVAAGNDPVAEAGCGLTVAPEDPQAVASGLLQLAALSPEERRALGERGRAFVLQHHAWPVLAERFLQALR